MSRVLVFFYLALALWLGGFLAAGITSGAPAAVVVGTFGLLASIAMSAVRIGPQQHP